MRSKAAGGVGAASVRICDIFAKAAVIVNILVLRAVTPYKVPAMETDSLLRLFCKIQRNHARGAFYVTPRYGKWFVRE